MKAKGFLFGFRPNHVFSDRSRRFCKPSLGSLCHLLDPTWRKICLLKLRLQERSLRILQVYAPNAETQYQPFLDKAGIAIQKVKSAESIVLLGNFNAHVGTDDKTWKGVIGRQGDSDINKSGSCLLQFCATNKLCIIIPFFGTRRFTSTSGTEIPCDSFYH